MTALTLIASTASTAATAATAASAVPVVPGVVPPRPGGGAYVLAHGIGAQHDLPVSPFYAFAGAFTALFVSFLALGLLWSRSRFRGAAAGAPLPAAVQRLADAPATRTALRTLGLIGWLFVVLHLLLGPDDPARNPAPGAVYVLLWVGLVPASLLLGPVWRLLNPLRTLHLLVSHLPYALSRLRSRPRPAPDSASVPVPVPASAPVPAPASASASALVPVPVRVPVRRSLPVGVGQWPAAVGLFGFTWLELVAPDPASATALLTAVGVHTAVQLLGAARYGAGWFERADAFEAYSALLARLAPLGRRADGRLVLRSPFNGLDATPQQPGLVATVCVLLGSTAYDGFSDTPSWINTLQTSSLGRTPTATLGLLAAVALVASAYCLCAAAVRLLSGPVPRPLTAFAHSLLPIALGYLTAHYFSLLVTEGPRTVMVALGADNALPPEPPLGPGGLAALQVAAVVTGHVLGVVAAHDRSVRLFPPARAVAGQLPLLVLMIAYTIGGLGLLLT